MCKILKNSFKWIMRKKSLLSPCPKPPWESSEKPLMSILRKRCSRFLSPILDKTVPYCNPFWSQNEFSQIIHYYHLRLHTVHFCWSSLQGFFSEYCLLLLLFTWITHSLYKISRNCLEWIPKKGVLASGTNLEQIGFIKISL